MKGIRYQMLWAASEAGAGGRKQDPENDDVTDGL